MAKTVAEISAACDALSRLLAEAKQETTDLWSENEKLGDIVQTIREESARQREELTQSRKQIEDGKSLNREFERIATELRRELAEVRQENALLRQRLDDHFKRVETWSGRLWALIVVLIGAVMSLASGLIISLNRK